MKRYLLLAGVIAIATLALSGCQWLFAPRVDDVAPEDLKSYSASSSFATDEDSVLTAAGNSTMAGAMGPAYVFQN